MSTANPPASYPADSPQNSPQNSAASTLLQIEALLDRFTHFGVELGLERIQRLLAALGDPQNQVQIVHVAGSNGKGSVCAYLSSVLTTAGYRVGRYTSPHLVSWCERICINQKEIPAIELLSLLQTVVAAIDPRHSSPTQFEVITAAAWLYFAQQQVDIAVVEVGLGGRLDATNVCDRPLVSVITSLSLEHCQKLGPTLSHIAYEKAGILKPQRPVVIASQPDEAIAVLNQRLAELNCPAVWVQPALEMEQTIEQDGNRWAQFLGADFNPPVSSPLTPLQYPLPLPGQHQLINSALAIATLQLLQQQGWQLSEAQIQDGMAKAEWRGRMQWFDWEFTEQLTERLNDQTNPKRETILIDGAHNPAGAEMLRQYVDSSDRVSHPVCWVMGLLTTKEPEPIFTALLHPGDSLVLVPVPDHLSADLQDLAETAIAVCPTLKAYRLEANVIAGLKTAIETRPTPHSTIVLCGSLYLIGDFFKRVNFK
jgi:dihydrofolate synthase/folylpolyglutamate synthase